MAYTWVAKLERVTDLKGETLFFKVEGGGPGNSRYTFIRPEFVPAFEGNEAWFELEKIHSRPWAYWQATKRIEQP